MAWADQLPSGRWRASYRDARGRRRSAGTFAHKPAATRAANAAEAEARKAGHREPSTILMREWAATWAESRAVAPSTRATDDGRVALRILPAFGDRTVASITRHEIREWAIKLANSTSPGTMQRYMGTLSSILSGAVDAEIIPANPSARLKLPRPIPEKTRYLDADERARLLDAVDGRNRAMIAVGLGMGLRWGEIVGMRRNDIRAGIYEVRQTWNAATQTMKQTPKGGRSRRVPIPAWVSELIDEHGHDGLLFQTTTGQPVDHSNWIRDVWTPAKRLADLGTDVTIHTMRHTYASVLVQAGVTLYEVARLLGHASIVTTQRYAHLGDEAAPHIMAALGDPRGAGVGQNVGQRGAKRGAKPRPAASIDVHRQANRPPRIAGI